MTGKVAVVLSGGGAKGAYEAGTLASIVQEAKIHVLTGSSIGAVNAAVFAWEYEKTGDLNRAAQRLQEAWLELEELFEISLWKILGSILLSQLQTGSPLNFPSVADPRQIEAKIRDYLPAGVRLSDLSRIELAINATCLTTGQSVSFTNRHDLDLGEAVLASSAIPLLLPPRKIGGRYYVDGGVFNNTPLRDAILAQATDIIVVELKPQKKHSQEETEFSGVYQVGARLLELIGDKLMYEDMKKAKRINEVLEVISALEEAGNSPALVESLKKSIGYEQNGRVKRQVRIYEIFPSRSLEPPGTLGFHHKEAILEIMRLGAEDAKRQLASFFSQVRRAAS